MVGDKLGSIRRVDMQADPVVLERWDDEKKAWVWSPSSVVAVSGFASDTLGYREMTADEAQKATNEA